MYVKPSGQGTKLARAIREYTSSPCWTHEADPEGGGYETTDDAPNVREPLQQQGQLDTRAPSDTNLLNTDLSTQRLP